MLNLIIRTALNNRLAVVAVAVAMMVYGAMQARELPIDVLPDLTRPRVVLITECPGLAPEEVETLVTFPMEAAVNGATAVTSVRSSSDIGLSVIYVDFDWGQDVYVARQIVSERIASVLGTLPDNVKPRMGPISSLLGQIMLIGMWSEDGTTGPLELRTLGDWVVRTRLLRIQGVAEVITIGGGRMQYQVLVDPHALQKYNVSLRQVESALRDGNLNVSGGYVNRGANEILVRGIGRIRDLADIESIVIDHRSQRPVLVRDVATVVKRAQVKRGDAAINGIDGVVLTIQKQPGTDTRQLTDDIEQAIAEMQLSMPDDVHIEATYKQREFIDYSVSNVIEAVRDGAILVVIVLFLFLFNIRTTLITLTAIPLSILTTALVFHFMGLSINVMTLGGIAVALGELVDDAIVDIENIFRRLKQNRHSDAPRPVLVVIYDASSEVRGAIMMSTVMVVLVFAPLFALSGMAGRMFTPLGIAYVVSITASTLVSLTVTPVLSYYLLPSGSGTKRPEGFVLRGIKTAVRPLLRLSLTRSGIFLVSVTGVVSVLVAGVTVSRMGINFLPAFDEGAAQVNLFLSPGTSLQASNKVRRLADLKFAELLKTEANPQGPLLWFTCKTGRAENDEYVMSLNPNSGLSREEVIEQLEQAVADLAGVETEVEQPIFHLISHMLSGVTAEIAIKIFGEDLQELEKIAKRIKTEIKSIDGLAEPMVEQLTYIPQIRIELKREQLARYGVTPAYIHQMVETALNGRVVSSVLDGQRSFDLLVRFDDEFRSDFESLDRTPIELPDGARVPLSELAKIRQSMGPNKVKREDTRRRIVVRVNTRGRDLRTAVDEIRETIANNIKLPSGYSVIYSGQFEEQESATNRLLIFSALAIVGVFVVLFSAFSSTNLVLQILAALPIAFAGGVAALVLTGQSLSVASMVGFISLGGIAARNGILLVETYLAGVKQNGRSHETIIQGSLDRVAPVLMTALTTGIGLVPLVIGGHLPGKEILFPVATVILGGLTTSTMAEFLLRPGMFWFLTSDDASQGDAPDVLSGHHNSAP
jgi:CzcA family heavy metal efflux pump